MRELERRLAALRLRLAEVNSREEQLKTLQRQFRTQLEKVVDFAVYQNADLDTTLSMAGDIDGRLAETDRMLVHLSRIRSRVQEELEALQLTRSIEQAKLDLVDLEARWNQIDGELHPGDSGAGGSEGAEETPSRRAQLQMEQAGLEQEMKRLRRLIDLASEEAARAVSTRTKHPV